MECYAVFDRENLIAAIPVTVKNGCQSGGTQVFWTICKITNASGSPRHSAEKVSQPNMPFCYMEFFRVWALQSWALGFEAGSSMHT